MIYGFSKEIKRMLLELLKNNTVVVSWGISNLTIEGDEITFEVDALKYKGVVAVFVSKRQNYYDLKIGEKVIKELLINEVVDMIDKEVEYSNNYPDLLTKILKMKPD